MTQIETNHSRLQDTYQQQLEASEHRFRSLVRHGSDLMAILDSSANYLYVTDPTKRVLGYSAGYFIGKNALEFIHPEDAPFVLAAIKRIDPDENVELMPYRFKASNGEWRWIESKITNLIGDPAVSGLVVNSRDITEKTRLEAERLHEAEKRQKQLMLAIVQTQEKERRAIGNELHDNVNQILTTVKLYLTMARDNDETRENLIPKSIDYIEDCINEIRKLSNRLVSLHRPHIELNDAISELIESIAATGALQLNFNPMLMQGLEISEEVQLAVYRIIQEQLTNVIRHSNAVSVEVSLAGDEQNLYLKIADDGQGFDMGQKRKGVGIMNMYNRAAAVNGLIEIESRPGEGCRLTAEFPVKTL